MKRGDAVKRNDLGPALLWIALGLFVLVKSIALDLGRLESPGPGMFPFLVGMILIFCTFPVLLGAILSAKTESVRPVESLWRGIDFTKIIIVLASLAVYALVLERIGYLLSAFLVLIVLFRTVGSRKWSSSILIALLTTILSYLFFAVLLGVELPEKFVRIF